MKLDRKSEYSAVVSYSQGNSVEPSGPGRSVEIMKEFCKSRVYKIVNTTYKSDGRKGLRIYTEFICVKKQQ
jgi:hypothetical protein